MKKAKGLLGEFKEFISRGNVMDLAVGMIIGAAFTAIVKSLVDDLIMPLIGWMFGGIDFTELSFTLKEAVMNGEEVVEEAVKWNYGNFIQAVVNFLLVALVIFILVKTINSFHRKKEEAPAEEPAPAEPSEEVQLLREIRDSLKK